jgi:hypothetical protein
MPHSVRVEIDPTHSITGGFLRFGLQACVWWPIPPQDFEALASEITNV